MSWIRMAAAGIALCASATAAQAQGTTVQKHEGHAGMHGKAGHVKKLFEGITLSADQQTRIDAIHAKHKAAHASTSATASPNGSASATHRAGRTAMMEQHYAEIRTVLDADQQKAFDANVQEMKKKRQERRAKQTRT